MSTENKNAYLSIRISQKDKAKIERKAKNLGIKLPDYVRKACLNPKGEKIIELKLIYTITILQEISNYIEMNYDGDKFIEGDVKKIWDYLL